jgi:predicted nucleic acid-binding OB-fold protein
VIQRRSRRAIDISSPVQNNERSTSTQHAGHFPQHLHVVFDFVPHGGHQDQVTGFCGKACVPSVGFDHFDISDIVFRRDPLCQQR